MAALKKKPAKKPAKQTRKASATERRLVSIFSAQVKALEARAVAAGDLRRGRRGAAQKLAKAEADLERKTNEVHKVLRQVRATGTEAEQIPAVLEPSLRAAMSRMDALAREELKELKSATQMAVREAKRVAARARAQAARAAKKAERERTTGPAGTAAKRAAPKAKRSAKQDRTKVENARTR